MGWGRVHPRLPAHPAPLKATGVGVGEREGWMGLEDIKETQKLPIWKKKIIIIIKHINILLTP